MESSSIPLLDRSALSELGHAVRPPFRIRLDGDAGEILCGEVYRAFPGRRLVCRANAGGRNLVLKILLDPGRAGRDAERSIHGTRAIERAGLPTPALVLDGTLNGGRVLGFEEIADAVRLDLAWRTAGSPEERRRMFVEAARLMAGLHSAGLCHPDAHHGNFLFSGDRIFIIDPDDIDTHEEGRTLDPELRLQNIALFLGQIPEIADDDIPAAFEAYAEALGLAPNDAIREVLRREIRKSRMRRRKSYLRKIYRTSTAHVAERSFGHYLICDRRLHGELPREFLDDPNRWMSKGRILKPGNTSTVTLVEWKGESYVVKRYNIKNIWHALSRAFRPTRAEVSWRNAHLLRFLGVRTPEPVFFRVRTLGPIRSTAWLVTRYVEGPTAFDLLPTPEGERHREAAAEDFLRFFKVLRSARISYGDMKATNFLVGQDGLWMVDLDAMKEHRSESGFRRAFATDLARFRKNWEGSPEMACLVDGRLHGMNGW